MITSINTIKNGNNKSHSVDWRSRQNNKMKSINYRNIIKRQIITSLRIILDQSQDGMSGLKSIKLRKNHNLQSKAHIDLSSIQSPLKYVNNKTTTINQLKRD